MEMETVRALRCAAGDTLSHLRIDRGISYRDVPPVTQVTKTNHGIKANIC